MRSFPGACPPLSPFRNRAIFAYLNGFCAIRASRLLRRGKTMKDCPRVLWTSLGCALLGALGCSSEVTNGAAPGDASAGGASSGSGGAGNGGQSNGGTSTGAGGSGNGTGG